MAFTCHRFGKLRISSEAKPKDLANEKEILRFAQNDKLYYLFVRTLLTPVFCSNMLTLII